MRIAIPRETHPGENRIPIVPADAKKLVRLGAEVVVEAGMGQSAGFSDEEYTEAGATLSNDHDELLGGADVLLRLRKPQIEEIAKLKNGAIHISYLDPFNEHDLVHAFRDAKVTAISMEMIPRTTRSQKMDALSSQANLAGYMTVILAAANLPRILPMMMTPAGTLKPANVFVIGAGVAGLQAIATAKRLGAKVVAFDTRPVVAEQVQLAGRQVPRDRPGRYRPKPRAATPRNSRRAGREAAPGAEGDDRQIRRGDHHGTGVRPQAPGARHRKTWWRAWPRARSSSTWRRRPAATSRAPSPTRSST